MSAETATLPQQSQQQLPQGQQAMPQNQPQMNPNFPLNAMPMGLPLPVPLGTQLVPNAGTGIPFQNASLYVGDLHPDVNDSTLYDIFNAVGPVASIRVCRDALSRKSLGYAYVNFHNPKDAERALDTMNYTLIKDRPCRIMWSQRDPSLRKTGQGNVFVKHLDLSIDNKALYDTFSLFGNILSCKVVTDSQGKSRGYGFVHFETPEAADEAIKKINGMLIAGKEVFVGRFLKKHDRPTAKDFTNVYVKNVPKQWTKGELEDFFAVCGPIASSIVMTTDDGRNRGFGFIDFAEHEGAENAISKFDKFEIIVDDLRELEKTSKTDKNKDLTDKSESYPKGDENDEFEEDKSGSTLAEKLPDGKVKLTLSVCRAQKKSDRERELARKFHELKIERQNKYDGVNLYVKNLDDRVDDDILRKEFEPFGSITSARVMRERLPNNNNLSENSNQSDEQENVQDNVENNAEDKGEKGDKILPPSKGFGFVCYLSPEEAVKAVTEMNGKMLFGKPLYVTLAQRKEQRRVQLEAQHRQNQRLINQIPIPNINPLNPLNNLNMNNFGNLNSLNMNLPQSVGVGMNSQVLNNVSHMLMMQNLAAQRGFNSNNTQANPNIENKPTGPRGANMNNFQSGPGPNMSSNNPRGPPRPRNINPNFMNAQNMNPNPNFINNRSGNPNMNNLNNPNSVQFNTNARNTQMQQQQMPVQGFQGGARRNVNMMSNAPNLQPNVNQNSALNANQLANASPSERKTIIGEQLYPLVARLEPSLAAKITGMLLEMELAELLHLIESPESLMNKVREAVDILRHAQGNE